MDFPSIVEQSDRPYISTGHLLEPEMVQRLVSDARRRFKSNGDVHNSQVYPALALLPEIYSVSASSAPGEAPTGDRPRPD